MVISSFQVTAPGSFTSVAPMCWLGCQNATIAPPGSMANTIRPASITSNGSMSTLPPAAPILAAASSAESTVM